MNRREFLAVSLAATAFASAPACAVAPASRTRWKVRLSEGYDAICFLGALSGGELYLRYYKDEASAFRPRLPAAVAADIAALWKEAAEPVGLFGPFLAVIFSSGHDESLASLIAASSRPEILRASYAASRNWDDKSWSWFVSIAPRLRAVFEAMRDADFAGFRRQLIGPAAATRPAEIAAALAPYDVISWEEKLTGRRFDPTIEVVLLYFSKPHGISTQGQSFLQALDYPLDTTVRIAAHEMLHPPIDMDGAAAKAALAVLERDPLITRIVGDHDPSFGYTTLQGMFDEDLVEALDQLISEQLGVAKLPATRWKEADDGMHVLAAGLYGLLKQDRWAERGGNIEKWIGEAARRGRLAPAVLHPVAAEVLQRPADRLWPISKA
jgi:hypothetical protein